MTREQLFALHEKMTLAAKDIMVKKNSDYGGNEDPLKNLRLHGSYGISVRLHDKICRLESASSRELKVKDETVLDTALDVINYAILYIAMQTEEKS